VSLYIPRDENIVPDSINSVTTSWFTLYLTMFKAYNL
jgi:hypothetical protein